MTDKIDSEDKKDKSTSKSKSSTTGQPNEKLNEQSKATPKKQKLEKQIAHQIEPTKMEKSSEALFTAAPIPKMAAKKSKNNWLMPSIVGLLVISALLVSGWTFYQQSIFNENWQTLQTDFKNQINQQTQSIEQTKKNSQTALQAANSIQLQLNQFITKNQQLSDSLLSTQERIKALSGRKKQDWMLAEVAHLIKLAQLKLSLQKDKQTAIQLLKTADQQIIEIADNNLLPLREAIANDLSELSLIIDTDVTGIYLQLNAINTQIPHLEITALEFKPIEKTLAATEKKSDEFKWKDVYQNFLTDFVVIKDHSEPVKPLMTADQRANLNSNIQLAIQQSQIALLQGDESLYQLNIENVIQWSNEYFKHDQALQKITSQLTHLKTKIIEARYPSTLHAKKSLNDISQQQLYRWLDHSKTSIIEDIKPQIINKTEAQPSQTPAPQSEKPDLETQL